MVQNSIVQKLANVHFWAHLTGGNRNGCFMGMAELSGMLRRSLYVHGEYYIYMILAIYADVYYY